MLGHLGADIIRVPFESMGDKFSAVDQDHQSRPPKNGAGCPAVWPLPRGSTGTHSPHVSDTECRAAGNPPPQKNKPTVTEQAAEVVRWPQLLHYAV
jgi:hypothetical protein